MTTAVVTGPGGAVQHPVHHDEPSFVRKYIFSTDHKVIGIQFLFMSLLFLVIGGALAMLMRYQLAWPGEPLPMGLGETRAPGGIILPEFYNSLVTMHGTIMVFFAIMPLLVGVFANYLIPLQIGAPDMAFPRINMLSFWLAVPAGILIVASFFVIGGAAGAGWTAYAPLSAVSEYSGVQAGQNLWNISLIILGFSSILGALNYITTVINMRAPGMTWFRMPLPVWALFITAILILLAVPVLTGALIMLLFDNVLGTTFFLPASGGEPLLWQHLFWFFGHPEVYILILPAMGFVSEIIANGSRKPVFGYPAMVIAIASIAILGWLVWGHHMFQSGMNPMLGSIFMGTTMVIAVPSAIKVFNWLATMWKGDLHFHVPMLHAISFVALFVVGGLSGVFLASTPVDIYLHDTYFVVAHLHYVLFGGSLFGIFAAITYWYPKMFGRMMNETVNRIHWLLTFIGFNAVFFPMHMLGSAGMMRRLYDYTEYPHLEPLQETNIFMTWAAFALFAAQLLFAVNFIWCLFRGRRADPNPWNANSLEWTTPSPPPHGNFPATPVVHRGPYEYSSPDVADRDWYPQDELPRVVGAPAHAAETEVRR
ncbi:MAG TPA: cbb3-type cytochrome c oxidase subunit I [Longimicrobiales bacterium]|nr:cbb3-type cytochrome c oxidase subunit I [Longimicrobiales bacterium]